MVAEVLIAFWWITIAAVLAWIARRRGESPALWFAIALGASPLLAVLFLIALPQRK